jgi:hypothetical protein
VIVASYDGECASCDGAIYAGQHEIRSDGQGGWVHADAECDEEEL